MSQRVRWIPEDGERVWVYWSGRQVWGTIDEDGAVDDPPYGDWSHWLVTFDEPQPCDCPQNCDTVWPGAMYPLIRLHPADEPPKTDDPDIVGMRHQLVAEWTFG